MDGGLFSSLLLVRKMIYNALGITGEILHENKQHKFSDERWLISLFVNGRKDI